MDIKVIDKIQKLLALSKSDNVNEAATAATRAAELMLQYKIEAADLEIAEGRCATHESVAEETLEGGNGERKAWRGQLAHALANAFNARSYSKVRSDQIQIIGRASDVQTVRYLMAFLSNEIERLCKRDWRSLLDCYKDGDYDDLSPPNAKAWHNSFKLGAVAEIASKMKSSKQEHEAAAPQTRGLVLVRQADALARAEVDAVVERLSLRNARTKISAPGAYASGRVAAREIDMSADRNALPGSRKRLSS